MVQEKRVIKPMIFFRAHEPDFLINVQDTPRSMLFHQRCGHSSRITPFSCFEELRRISAAISRRGKEMVSDEKVLLQSR